MPSMVSSRLHEPSLNIFRSAVLAIGFTESSSNYALFPCQTPRGITLLLLYVDDMVISGDDVDSIISLKQHL